ncbi:MAG TPA: hypothetical protein DEP72_01665 [Clostridiales bacterium]|nr:MAG: hypothetical protein A2Y18_07580 [Clostridiales bacterium GWD2_32_19]HCC06861.1 hypothetical protein [Clostridiales bacterium]
MSIQFVFGLSGTGKTEYLIDKVTNLGYEQKIFYIVPEPEVICMQKKIIAHKKSKGLINIEVLSFEKLIYRVFEEVGLYRENKIDKLQNSMLITKILLENKKLNINKNYITEMCKVISEFIKYNIGPEFLENKIKGLRDQNEELFYKISEIKKIYESYLIHTDNLNMIPEQSIELIIDKINEVEIINNAVFCIDEFYDFSPFQLEIIKALLNISKHMYMTLPMEAKSDKKFASIVKTIGDLKYFCIVKNIKVEDDIYLKQNKRYERIQDIAHLEKNFLRDKVEKFDGDPINVCCSSASNVYEEVEYVTMEVLKLVHSGNYRYKDIAIAYSNQGSYKDELLKVLNDSRIPVSFIYKDNITNYSLVRFVLTVFEVLKNDFDHESVNKYLKTNYANISEDDASQLDKYILSYGIKGYETWVKDKWNYEYMNKYSQDKDGESINIFKNKVIEPFVNLNNKLETNEIKTVEKYTLYLYEFLEEVGVPEKVKDKYNHEIYGEYNIKLIQVWNQLVQALDSIIKVVGKEEVTIEQYMSILDIAINNITDDEKNDFIDAALVEDVKKIMVSDKKVLFLLGVNDGYIPEKKSFAGLLNREERDFLYEVGINIERYNEDKIYEEQIQLYTTTMKAEEKVYFSYALQDTEGKSINPAMFINKLKKMFEKLIISKYEKIENKTDGKSTCSKEMYKLTSDVVGTLYPGDIRMSATSLQDYAMCPFKFFAKYNLKALEKQVYRLQNLDIGKLYHAILNMFFEKINAEDIDIADLNEEKIRIILDELICEYIMENNIFSANSKYKFITSSLKNILLKSIKVMTEHINAGDFAPTYFELGFSTDGILKPLKIDIDNGKQIIMNGKIDRVDLLKRDGKTYVKVIDYKSGNMKFDIEDVNDNVNMQLVLYMMAILEDKGFAKDSEVLPAGVFYFKIGNKKIKLEDSNIDNIEDLLKKKYKMSGLIIGDKDMAKSMDKEMEAKSNIIPVEFKKDGELTKKSSVTGVEEFYKIIEQMKENITQIGKEILEGNVEAKPYKKGSIKACEYCEYKDICGIDVR